MDCIEALLRIVLQQLQKLAAALRLADFQREHAAVLAGRHPCLYRPLLDGPPAVVQLLQLLMPNAGWTGASHWLFVHPALHCLLLLRKALLQGHLRKPETTLASSYTSILTNGLRAMHARASPTPPTLHSVLRLPSCPIEPEQHVGLHMLQGFVN